MLGPIGALDKRSVVFVDVLTPMLLDLYGERLDHILAANAVIVDGPVFDNASYIDACRVPHSQTSFAPFNPDGN